MDLPKREELVEYVHRELAKLNDKKIQSNSKETIKQMNKIKSIIKGSENE